jgi:hypothetical protein
VMPWPAPRTGAIKLAAGAGPNVPGAERTLTRKKVRDCDPKAREDQRVAD